MKYRKLLVSELNRLSCEEFDSAIKTPIAIVLDNIRSQYNIGSIFRTCDALLVEKIMLCGISATPQSAEIHKTALGAEDTMKWEYFKNTADAVNQLKRDNYVLVAIEQAESSIMLNDFAIRSNCKYALVFGNEVKGIQQEVVNLCDFCVEIPQFGTKHSLNIAVSAGIALWDFFCKLKEPSSDGK
ncbi:MAG: RNA methyltransferase [Prevotellaceae bacterium]|jgi:tRNA G18 (ribose-2'-O)-methylase SpoU|nr:RNA methyltransferase [Prevotellaceae bacterium]